MATDQHAIVAHMEVSPTPRPHFWTPVLVVLLAVLACAATCAGVQGMLERIFAR